MKNILIIPGETEKEYSRMLELELKKRGLRTTCNKGEAKEDTVVILVLEEATPELVERLADVSFAEDCSVVCCARLRAGIMPPNVVFFERPMDIERFCEFIRLISDKGKEQAQSEKGFAGDLVIDRNTKTVFCRGESIRLTERELQLLLYLDLHRGETVTREDAGRELLGVEYTGDTNLVDVYMRYLRKKLDERFDAKFIVTVRGKGYMLRK